MGMKYILVYLDIVYQSTNCLVYILHCSMLTQTTNIGMLHYVCPMHIYYILIDN